MAEWVRAVRRGLKWALRAATYPPPSPRLRRDLSNQGKGGIPDRPHRAPPNTPSLRPAIAEQVVVFAGFGIVADLDLVGLVASENGDLVTQILQEKAHMAAGAASEDGDGAEARVVERFLLAPFGVEPGPRPGRARAFKASLLHDPAGKGRTPGGFVPGAQVRVSFGTGGEIFQDAVIVLVALDLGDPFLAPGDFQPDRFVGRIAFLRQLGGG